MWLKFFFNEPVICIELFNDVEVRGVKSLVLVPDLASKYRETHFLVSRLIMSEPYGYCFYFPCSSKTCLKRSSRELLLFWCMCVSLLEGAGVKWVWKWKWKWKFRWRTLLPEAKVTNLPLGNDKCLFMDKLGARSRGHFNPPPHPHPQIGEKCILQGELGCQKSRSLYLPPPRPPPPNENEKWTSCREFSWQKSRCYFGPVSGLSTKSEKGVGV